MGSGGARHAQQPAPRGWGGPLLRLPASTRHPHTQGPCSCLFPCPRHSPGGPQGQGQAGLWAISALRPGPSSAPWHRTWTPGAQVDACQGHWFSDCLGCQRVESPVTDAPGTKAFSLLCHQNRVLTPSSHSAVREQILPLTGCKSVRVSRGQVPASDYQQISPCGPLRKLSPGLPPAPGCQPGARQLQTLCWLPAAASVRPENMVTNEGSLA